MNQAEYEQRKNDNRVGKCPFCGMPGKIVGYDENWCEHYIGTENRLNGIGPVFTLISGEPFSTILRLVERIEKADSERFVRIASEVSEANDDVITTARHTGSQFWQELVDFKILSVTTSETSFITNYSAYFVSSFDETRKILTERVQEALNALRGVTADMNIGPD